MKSQFLLLKERRFLPLFILQFFGAFNDNLAKTAFVVLMAYGLWDAHGVAPEILVSVAAGVFILPFILFCPFAGYLADHYDKALIIRRAKLAEIFIALAAVAVLYSGNLYFALPVLFALGLQSAFFTPSKFSILPQHLKADELIGGNALVSTGTYLAILGGTMIGAALIPLAQGKFIVSVLLIGAAVLGYWAALFVPSAPARNRPSSISLNIFKYGYAALKFSFQQKPAVLASILGTSWFYFIAATYHAQFPNFTKQTLGAQPLVLSLFMAVFSVGVGLGGLLNHRILRGRTHGRYVPVAAALICVFGLDLYWAARAFPLLEGGQLYSLSGFLALPQSWRIMADSFFQAMACGFFVVPLRAIVQAETGDHVSGRVISASNMMDAVFILLSAVIAGFVFSKGVSVEGLYLMVSVLTLGVGGALYALPSFRVMSVQSREGEIL
ncbi:MAG: MFS transporter [Alphaproteobacteria bacterium]|nr:MFS transporter [Alphaproteobacteria bacterium]